LFSQTSAQPRLNVFCPEATHREAPTARQQQTGMRDEPTSDQRLPEATGRHQEGESSRRETILREAFKDLLKSWDKQSDLVVLTLTCP
jgi:hypothetical protein